MINLLNVHSDIHSLIHQDHTQQDVQPGINLLQIWMIKFSMRVNVNKHLHDLWSQLQQMMVYNKWNIIIYIIISLYYYLLFLYILLIDNKCEFENPDPTGNAVRMWRVGQLLRKAVSLKRDNLCVPMNLLVKNGVHSMSGKFTKCSY